MASVPLSYRESSARASQNRAPRFDVAELIAGSDLPRGPRHTLKAMYEVSRRPFGQEIQLWPAGKGIELRAQIAERTRRYHLRKLEAIGVLEIIYSANSRIRAGYFRHTTTYRLRVDRLKARPSYADYKNSLPVAEPRKPSAGVTSLPESPPATPASPPAKPTPERSAPAAPKLTTRQRKDLVSRIAYFKRGVSGNVPTRDGAGRWIGPDDPDYREAMDRPNAIVAACRSMSESEGVSLDRALEAAAEAGFVLDPEILASVLAADVPPYMDGAKEPARYLNKAERRRDSNLEVNARVKQKLRDKFDEENFDA